MNYEQILDDYKAFYSGYNRDPQAWEAENGDWAAYEAREKALLLAECGRIMELLSEVTANETALDTDGDAEYYSTVRRGFEEIRTFLEQHVQK